MRTIQKELIKTQATAYTVNATSETIATINENKNSKSVVVSTEYRDENGIVLGTESVVITGGDYELLMQANPSYAPQKQINEYRESDLWHIIDLIRSRNNS